MNVKDFTELLERRLELTRKVLTEKSAEYSQESDKLYNFKRAAGLLNCTPEKALVGMLAKHLVSVFDMVDGTRTPTKSMIDEKIGDTINYFCLLEAVLNEKSY